MHLWKTLWCNKFYYFRKERLSMFGLIPENKILLMKVFDLKFYEKMTNINSSIVCKGLIKLYTFNMVSSITLVTTNHSVWWGWMQTYAALFIFSTILSKWLTSASLSSFQLMLSLLLASIGSLKRLRRFVF